MILEIMEPSLSVLKLNANETIPNWALNSTWFSITRTSEELSIVCPSLDLEVNLDSNVEHGWKGLKVTGILDFSLTGILASLAVPLAEHKISIFAVSTFNTDYILVKEELLSQAKAVLEQAGHTFTTSYQPKLRKSIITSL
ncbi:ACT domain-containing protein [Paenibacillus sp. LHD-117]|uniref:ACT domain-containing protein n=1 Tax=Paenibacillus sp. LHD-117 TaxID=3071412 RepID=UPI0027E0B88C|nr:ACT domain-containing protein [Paenibacillus sp. LHD-117]MDQ6418451.1 ACT domain-containing protein [Paenibacillus sp. LHD-117]